MRYDIVGISIRKKGLAKFVATALLAGYVAMMLTGIFFFGLGGQPLAYDVLVHTFFIGFVFSMIFAHGPIILPGVLGIAAKPFHPLLYVWLVLLHLSLVTRIAGDLILNLEERRISAWMSAVAIFAYFATIATITTKNYERDA